MFWEMLARGPELVGVRGHGHCPDRVRAIRGRGQCDPGSSSPRSRLWELQTRVGYERLATRSLSPAL